MTVDQHPLPSVATWPRPAVAWPVPRDRSDPRSLQAATEANEREPAPMPSQWPRIFPGL